ncbi:MAG: response regulator [Lachnospiraceae bacterium]|nr:response regulator [Lachnospiraceae bacterium]
MYKVFLVDDDALILDELIRIVPWEDNGFEVAGSETSPVRALSILPGLSCDAVFCDLKMPGMDGNTLIRRLKEAGVTAEFVMISAYDDFENVRAFFQQNGYDYILKPVHPDDIQLVLIGLNERLSRKNPIPAAENPTENPDFNVLISYVQEHYTEKLSLNLLSREFGFSRSYICALFQKYYNKSLTIYVTQLRMNHAKELLADRTILIKEVACLSGYTDYYHFFKVFKNHFGISPREMRELSA